MTVWKSKDFFQVTATDKSHSYYLRNIFYILLVLKLCIITMSVLVWVVYWACETPLGVLSLLEMVECSIFYIVWLIVCDFLQQPVQSAKCQAQPLTYPRMGCKWLCVESSRSGEGMLLDPLSNWQFSLRLEWACGQVSKACPCGRGDSIDTAKTWCLGCCLKVGITIVTLPTL